MSSLINGFDDKGISLQFEDFVEIDADADEIDPSPANILKNGLSLLGKG